ncbi:MAG TPA: acyl-CoA dehydrogenase family protein [Longimicrobium sp.]|jgi:alkylation response protein AidB-like acyl-CoA dehydrogenase
MEGVDGDSPQRRAARVETLYREICALRIHEGTSEIQERVIAGQLLKGGVIRDGIHHQPEERSCA